MSILFNTKNTAHIVDAGISGDLLTLRFIREIGGIRTPLMCPLGSLACLGYATLYFCFQSVVSPPLWHCLGTNPVPTSLQTSPSPSSWSPVGKEGHPELWHTSGLRGEGSERRRNTQLSWRYGKQQLHQLFTKVDNTAQSTGNGQVGRLKFPWIFIAGKPLGWPQCCPMP